MWFFIFFFFCFPWQPFIKYFLRKSRSSTNLKFGIFLNVFASEEKYIIPPDNENINNPNILFDRASHSLFLLLNKSSLFIDSKYKKLFYFTEKSKAITKEIASLKNIEDGDIGLAMCFMPDNEADLKKAKKTYNWIARLLCLKDSPFKSRIIQSKKKYNRKKKVDLDYDVWYNKL